MLHCPLKLFHSFVLWPSKGNYLVVNASILSASLSFYTHHTALNIKRIYCASVYVCVHGETSERRGWSSALWLYQHAAGRSLSGPCSIMSNTNNLGDTKTMREKEKDRKRLTEGEKDTKRG